MQTDVNCSIGWPVGGFPGPQKQGPYYWGLGADKAIGRDIVDAHYKECLYAGIGVSGVNGEFMPGQWEFQVDMWRVLVLVIEYVLLDTFSRISDISGVMVIFDPKPVPGDRAGVHCNSTKSMRNDRRISCDKESDRETSSKTQRVLAAYGEGKSIVSLGSMKTHKYTGSLTERRSYGESGRRKR